VSAPLDVGAGYAALTGASGWLRLDRDVVRVAGPDAATYLQGQISQDVVALPTGQSAWTIVLQPQGRIEVWGRITRVGDDEFLLDTDGGFGEALVARLVRFKLRVKADVEALAWSCVAVRGPAAVRPAAPPVAVVARAEWPLLGGWDVLSPEAVPVDGVPEVPAEAFEVRRIEAGLPRMGAELTDRTIPAEAGIVEMSVSFTKGCYTGQELVARIDSRGGHVPRRLRGLTLPAGSPVPAPGTAVEVDGRERGAVTSAAGHPDGRVVALGFVARDVEPPADGECGGAAVTIAALPTG